ncbi:uncharacterized protein LOC114526913 isoform X2 [Dendronephthya gigantea]|uniref:uncharacterized protein LOC114526913 isoform X2 n=1 Tax=Dendronephthya gigantea TaxID=151771 RepID=UPI00106CD797|nr:uncharacterized protein LOC114526913 isoform X2 [Dendronephthya gigantea]
MLTSAVHRNTKERISRIIGRDWDYLAGLMDIPYAEREEVRNNYTMYPDFTSKAKKILDDFNSNDHFWLHILEKCFEEMGLGDLRRELLPLQEIGSGGENEAVEIVSTRNEKSGVVGTEQFEITPEKNVEPLSPREMCRLSQRVSVHWDSLAGLLEIDSEVREDIRGNICIYHDSRSKAEKILSIFNRRRDFSRKALAGGLKEIKKMDLIRPVMTGKWKQL